MAALIPRSDLIRDPAQLHPKVSPDGLMLSYLAPVDGIMNLWAGPIGTADIKPVTHETVRPIPVKNPVTPDYGWAFDNRHLLFWQDNEGDENWRLHAVDIETHDVRDLTPFPKVQARLLKLHPDFPTGILVGINKRNPALHDVYRLDIASGELSLVYENPGFVGWIANDQLELTGAMRMRDDGGIDILVRDGDDWRTVVGVDMADANGFRPVSLSTDGNTLTLLTSEGADTVQLVSFDIATGARTVLASHPEFDVADVDVDGRTLDVRNVQVVGERLINIPLDAEWASDLAHIGESLHGDVTVTSKDLADTTWILASASDTALDYYSFDRATNDTKHLFNARPWLADTPLAAMEPFTYEARDGLKIRGYLTFPVDRPRENLPTVLYVHGGPWARDLWGVNPMSQMLANRGYLVVQVNYRGSIGFGKAFVNAADRQWGAKMHDDLLDAVEHVVACGYANRQRVAIVGGSYGGYAALVGATFTPEFFTCAVEFCGPSNLISLVRSFPRYWGPQIALWKKRVGDPDTEEDFLWSRSPLSRVDDICRPLLVIQTENDARVTKAEADQIVASMEERGIPHTYVVILGEGHAFVNLESREIVFASIERFLAEHLGGSCQDDA